MLTVVEAALVGSAMLLAVTVAVLATLTSGAEKSPLVEIAPAVVLHVTAVSLVLLTVALNCFAVPEETVGLSGEI